MRNNPYNEFTSFEEIFEQAEMRLDYHVENAKNDFTEQLVTRMDGIGISRTELANRLGKKKSHITRILRGNNNFTIDTMVQIADALGCVFTCTLKPKEIKDIWFQNGITASAARCDYSSNGNITVNELEKDDGNFSIAA